MADFRPIQVRFSGGFPAGFREVPDGDTLPVALGGTGATTAAQARTNLGAAAAADLDARQPLDSDLTALAGVTSTGLLTKTGSGTAAARVISAGAGVSVSNGDGVAGNPTVALTGQALALHDLAASGLIARTGTGAVASRTLTGTANQVTVTNGNGVSGNPTFSLPQNIHTGATPEFAALTIPYSSGGTTAFGTTRSGLSAHRLFDSDNRRTVFCQATNASFADIVITSRATRAANSAYDFFRAESGDGADVEFRLAGDGNALADGSWTGGGADYAEFFEWADGNPTNEDRRGYAVALVSGKIRIAEAGDDPVGVISGNPSVVGDAAWNCWNGKHLRDDFGSYVLDADGHRTLNPAYDPDSPYTPRSERPEWSVVGLMGKLRLRVGQVTGARWIKLRDISATVEEWLVR